MAQEIIVDNNITVRPTVAADASLIFDAFSTQGNYLRQWLPIAACFNSPMDVEDYLEMSELEDYTNYTIIYNGTFAGIISLSHICLSCHRAELGYWLTKPLQGRGIMVKSLNALIQYAFNSMKMNRLEIKCAVGNERSRRIPIKLNFKLEGVERDGEVSADGHYNDLEVFSLLKREYIDMNNKFENR